MPECEHLDQIRDVQPRTNGCEECLKIGGRWVHLRLCMTCGHVGCCDSSPHKHATKHFYATRHPIIRSNEPGESWGWCYIDQLMLEFPEVVEARRRTI
ncbi:MAG: Zn-finger-containing protein [Bryobacterales bacterium]|nr:Zn-finger-containing protein [Bryobacterales bacterium]